MTASCLAILSQNWAGPQQTHFFIPCETWQPQADPISHVVTLALSTTTEQREKVTELCQELGHLSLLSIFHFSLGELRGHGHGPARCGQHCGSSTGSQIHPQIQVFMVYLLTFLLLMSPRAHWDSASLAKPVFLRS